MSIRSTYYRTDDLVGQVGLSRVYAASSDAANLSDAASARVTELEALRRERQALEARNRRHGEIGQHVSAARQLGYARRMQELQADAEAPAQENVPPPPYVIVLYDVMMYVVPTYACGVRHVQYAIRTTCTCST